MHLDLGKQEAKSIPLTFQMMKTNLKRRRKSHSWKLRKSPLPKKRLQIHRNMSHQTHHTLVITMKTNYKKLLITANVTHKVKTVVLITLVHKFQQRAQVNPIQSPPQTALWIYLLTAVWPKPQIKRRTLVIHLCLTPTMWHQQVGSHTF